MNNLRSKIHYLYRLTAKLNLYVSCCQPVTTKVAQKIIEIDNVTKEISQEINK